MSWSTYTETVDKSIAELAIDKLRVSPEDEITLDQFAAAKRAAKELLKTIPGPFVVVSLTGHANGVGWHKKDGYGNDMISVSVRQCFEDCRPALIPTNETSRQQFIDAQKGPVPDLGPTFE